MTGAVLICPSLFASCDFGMENISYFYGAKTQYKIKLLIDRVCARNPVEKRFVSGVTLKFFKNDLPIGTYHFDEGFWFEPKSKFLLKKNKAFESGCFKGTKNIQLDLNNKFINSTSGIFMSLESGKRLKISCPEFSET